MATSAAADALAVRLSHISSPKDVAAFGGVAGVANAIAGVLGSGGDAGVPSGAALLARGLSPAAAAASSRLFGANSLPTKPVKPFWEHFKEAFEDRTLQVRACGAAPRADGGGARAARPAPTPPPPPSFPCAQILVLSAAVSCFFAVYQKETDEILQVRGGELGRTRSRHAECHSTAAATPLPPLPQAIMMIAVIALVSGMCVLALRAPPRRPSGSPPTAFTLLLRLPPSLPPSPAATRSRTGPRRPSSRLWRR